MKRVLLTLCACTVALVSHAQTAEGSSNSIDLGPLLFKKLNEKQQQVVVVQQAAPAPGVASIVLASDVDLNIPKTTIKNKDAFAVVIGNAQYVHTSSVNFAVHDARAMKQYLVNALGFYEENVFVIENATNADFQKWFGTERSHRGRLYNLAYENIETNTDLFIFYAGHGAPDPNTKSGYFLPVDCDPNFIDVTAYSGELLFSNVNKIGARSTTIVLDACFSGQGIITGLSAVAIKPKDFGTIQNGVIISSSSGTQPSAWYEEKNHGLFTYYFLKALQAPATDKDANGEVTIDEIFGYVSDMVPRKARGLRNLDQNPTIQGDSQDRVLYNLASFSKE